VSASPDIIIDNIVVERDGKEVIRPIPIRDFFDMIMPQLRALELKIESLGIIPINKVTVDGVLSFGDRGAEVRDLQKLLNSNPDTQLADAGPGSPSQETLYFGQLTKDALIRFQTLRAGPESGAGSVGLVFGVADEKTREMLNNLYLR